MLSSRAGRGRRTVKVCRPHKGDVNSEVPVGGRAVKAEVYSKRYRCPCWILLPTVEANLYKESSAKPSMVCQEAYLVRRFRLQFFEDLVRLSLCRKSAHDADEQKKSVEQYMGLKQVCAWDLYPAPGCVGESFKSVSRV